MTNEQIMGGKAVKNVRPLNQDEMRPTYEWVEQNILPLLGLDKSDAIPIGSFGKKPLNETSGDIDIAIKSEKFMTGGLKFKDIALAIDCVLNEIEGFDTHLLKGFDQVSVSVPIKGDSKNGYAQVDLMPSPDLNWAKFMYHSPNLLEKESKYKGAIRNALMMALISESTKETTKLFEEQTEEYNSLAIRFPTGVWNIKRSLMGKKGKLIKKSTVLESEFITRNPQDVINIALGEGYGIGAANSFETLWEVIHQKDFIHKSKMNKIMSKFKVNLKSMRQDTPKEALIKYSEILNEDLKDIFKPKSEEDIKKEILYKIKSKKIETIWELFIIYDRISLDFVPKKDLIDLILELLNKQIDNRLSNNNEIIKHHKWVKNYLSEDLWNEILVKAAYKDLLNKYSNSDIRHLKIPTTLKEIRKIEKEFLFEKQKNTFLKFFNLLKDNSQYKSIQEIIQESIKNNQFKFLFFIVSLYNEHKRSYYTMKFIRKIYELINRDIKEIPRSYFGIRSESNQWGIKWIDIMIQLDLLNHFKKGNKQFVKLNINYRDDEEFISSNYYKLMKSLRDQIEKFGINE